MTATDNPMPAEIFEAMSRRPPDVISKSGVYQLHHAIFDKGSVVGLPLRERAKIHSVCNILKLPAEDNTSHANVPSRQEAYKMLCAREGKVYVDAWFASIRFKCQPFTLEGLQGE